MNDAEKIVRGRMDRTAGASPPVVVHLISAPEDVDIVAGLARHLQMLPVDTSHAGDVTAGHVLMAELLAQVDAAHAVLLVVSANLHAWEPASALIQRALTREGEIPILPVLGRSCLWRGAAYAHLQPSPRDGATIMVDGRVSEEALAKVAQEAFERFVECGLLAPLHPAGGLVDLSTTSSVGVADARERPVRIPGERGRAGVVRGLLVMLIALVMSTDMSSSGLGAPSKSEEAALTIAAPAPTTAAPAPIEPQQEARPAAVAASARSGRSPNPGELPVKQPERGVSACHIYMTRSDVRCWLHCVCDGKETTPALAMSPPAAAKNEAEALRDLTARARQRGWECP